MIAYAAVSNYGTSMFCWPWSKPAAWARRAPFCACRSRRSPRRSPPSNRHSGCSCWIGAGAALSRRPTALLSSNAAWPCSMSCDRAFRISRFSPILQLARYELEARRVDVVVSRLHSPPSEEYSAEVLYEDTLVVVTGLRNPLARRRKIEIAELLDEPWTFQPPDTNFGSFAMDAFRAVGLAPPRIAVATTSHTLHNELLATGRYLAMVPRFWVLLQRPNPSFKVLPVAFPHTQHKVAIITLKNRSLSSATQFFIDRVRAITKAVNEQKK